MKKTPSTQILFDRLLALVAVDVAATLAVLVESGRVAFVLDGLAVAVAIASAVFTCARLLNDARPADVEPLSRPALDHTKKILILAMLAGFISLVGGRSTWSSFSAETGNGSSISSGILTMSNAVNDATACLSTAALSQDNYNNAACDKVFNAIQNLAPGSVTPLGSATSFPLTQVNGASWYMSKVAIKNTGSIDSSSLSLYAPLGNAKLTTAITSGQSVGTVSFSGGFEGSIASNDKITLSWQGNSQSFCTNTVARPTQSTPVTSLTVVAGTCGPSGTPLPTTAAYDFGIGARVLDASSDTSPTNTNCYDVKTAASASFNFNLLTTNPLCQTLLMWVQEQTNGSNYCWFGVGSILQANYQTTGNAQCVTPTSQPYQGATINAAGAFPATLDLGTLAGNIQNGDILKISQNTQSNTCTVTGGPYYIGSSTPVSVTSCGTAVTTYTSGATVSDSTAFGKLDTVINNVNSTVSNFDTARAQATGPIFLNQLSGSPVGVPSTTGAPALTKSGGSLDTRTFYVGVYFPNPSGSNQNALQGLTSTFGIGWHMDQ